MDQCNRIEGPETNPHTYSQSSAKEARIYNGKKTVFSKWCWESWTVTCKLLKLEHILLPYTKTNSNYLKDLKIRHDTIKLLEENIGKTFSDINHSNVFLSYSPKMMEIKTKINKS